MSLHIDDLKATLQSVTQEIDDTCKEKGLDWLVYADKAIELRKVKSSLETLITFIERK